MLIFNKQIFSFLLNILIFKFEYLLCLNITKFLLNLIDWDIDVVSKVWRETGIWIEEWLVYERYNNVVITLHTFSDKR